jgi:hypothetical protein
MSTTTNKPYTLIALRHSGTHLIQPIIRSLTGKTCYVPKGQNALDCPAAAKTVVWLRDPRNTLVSQYRYKRGKDAPKDDASFAAALMRAKNGTRPIAYLLQWAERWGAASSCYVARFEDFVSADALGRIVRVSALAEYLLGPPIHGSRVESESSVGREVAVGQAIAYAFGTSGTYTGRHSQWEEWFGPRTREVWEKEGGAKLLQAMGYAE